MSIDYKLSIYQERILDYIDNNKGNLLVNAKAGSGKTSTLVLIADKIINQGKKCMYLAFNKSIVEELKLKIQDPSCDIRTIHSLGISFLRSYLYRKHNTNYKLEIDINKVRNIVRKIFGDICGESFKEKNNDLSKDEFEELYDNIISELCTLVNFSRHHNINYHDRMKVINLAYQCTRELWDYENLGLKDFPILIEKAINQIKYEFENPVIDEYDNKPIYVIDYVDMIYLPTYYNMFIPFKLKDFTDYILVDEAQDLTILQQIFLKRLASPSSRYIFVGDEKQAIYGFAGADTNSINNIKRNYQLTELPLNICYRCPENIIKIAKTIVPSIESNSAREDKGNIKFMSLKEAEDLIQPNDFILGRYNKDLLEVYIRFVFQKHLPIKFKNLELVKAIFKDLSQTIKSYIRSYNKGENIQVDLYKYAEAENIPIDKKLRTKDQQKLIDQQAVILAEENLANKEISRDKQSIFYLRTCMEEYYNKGDYNFALESDSKKQNYKVLIDLLEIFQNTNKNLITVKSFLSFLDIFLKGEINDEAPVLSTIHMMKGSESDNIYIYNYPGFPYERNQQTSDQRQQERNLQYVALTRAKKNLYLLQMEPKKSDDIDMCRKMNDECRGQLSTILNQKF